MSFHHNLPTDGNVIDYIWIAWSTVQGPLWYCVCTINSYRALLNWPIVSLLILFILFSNVFYFILVHDYTLCFSGSPCYNVSYYNYISISPWQLCYDHSCFTNFELVSNIPLTNCTVSWSFMAHTLWAGT